MILGIVSVLCCGIFAGIPAIILGNQAKGEIAASGGAQTGPAWPRRASSSGSSRSR